MTLEYTIVAAIVGALYVVIKNYLPDFPIPADIFLNTAIFILALAGVEVVGRPLAARIRRAFGMYER